MLFLRYQSLKLLALILTLSISACGGGGGGSNSGANTGPELSRIEVTPNLPTLAKGSSLTLTATGINSDSSTRPLSSEVTWLSSDDSIATVSSNGEVHAVAKGRASLQASLNGIIGSTDLNVTDATLSSLEISPGSLQLAAGTSADLSLVGHYSDGSTQNLDTQASWAVTDPAIANISDPAVTGTARLTGIAVGATQLSASLGAVSIQIAVTVSAANLVQITINPETPSLPLGSTLNLTASGFYGDGSSQDLSDQVSWNSGDTGILTIDASGVVLPQSSGSTTVSASLSGVNASKTVTVSNAVLNSIEINAASQSIPLGNQQPLLALGHYSDGSLKNITEQVTWKSTPETLLAISNADGSRGLSTALAVGAVTATATLGNISGSLALNSSPATLNSIEVSPLNARLAPGTQVQFNAVGTYSDGSLQNLTDQVSWSTGDASIASARNDMGNHGLVQALSSDSTTTVSATLNGVTGNASLAVSAAQLLTINVLPASLTLAAGTQQALSAEGSFSDGSVQNLDSQVIWQSNTPSVAGVDNGLVSTLKPGSARINASLGNASGSSVVTVTSATLQSLEISPSSPSLAVGTQTQLHVIAHYDDGSQKDVTTEATWSSADDALLRVSNSTGQLGQLTALASGSVAVSASLDGIQGSTTVTISNASLTGLRIIAASPSLDSAEQQPLTAMGDFSDSTSQDLTQQVIWDSSARNLADVSNLPGFQGQVLAGIGVSGTATITARYDGQSDSTDLTIVNTPQRPISLVVIATPNVIQNNGTDTSTLEVRVQAADPTATVADGTVIALQTLQNGIVLTTQDLVTSGGVASTSFTTTETGYLQITATIANKPISNNTALFTSSMISEVIAGAALVDAQASAGNILAGGRFGLFLYNRSNRDFPLLRFELLNGSDTLVDFTYPADFKLSGGARLGIVYTLPADIPDQGIRASYYLTDPASGVPFVISATFASQ